MPAHVVEGEHHGPVGGLLARVGRRLGARGDGRVGLGLGFGFGFGLGFVFGFGFSLGLGLGFGFGSPVRNGGHGFLRLARELEPCEGAC